MELDKHVEQLELAIASIDQLAKSLYKTDNKHLYDSTSLLSEMNSNNNWKTYSHSSQIPQQSKYKGDTDGDWDDILSPDDYDDYLEMRHMKNLTVDDFKQGEIIDWKEHTGTSISSLNSI